ncbi:siphovirus ReqiPepy6 Gp37-like family protein [Anaerotignum sp. MB30-C6]|uniref:siphovirus ReqiPepy6 Gp37-like family protein n=1 Tax=Anaerotignum sp. MB30-C6 TaxID=3070814 RepID=UPI0027DD3551|nr:siphovirus ReqiPepy6 Gp37-like family protein [Anaerotignum sp. MB30-C6]WMI82101.1 siphovirus ReqiPepy6 Gp37-like family protein [Anaerotignum sp. MB30-C6]
MDLYVYENFELQGLITQYDSLCWTRRFNDVGECEIVMPFDEEIFMLLKINSVLYHKQNNEACFVLQKNVTTDSFGNEKLTIIGKSISCILKNRITSFIGDTKISDLVTKLLNENFIKATNINRNIPNMVIDSVVLQNNPVISLKYENADVFTIIKEITQQYDIGFRINYDIANKRYVFELYEGIVQTDVKFSKEFNNVLEQEYYLNTTEHKNTCIVENDQGSAIIVNDGNKGLARKETYMKLDSQSTITAQEQGKLYLQQFKVSETLDTVMDTNSIQFFYLVDWNLGDVVTTVNKKLGVTIQKNIVEIEEFYDTTGLNLAVTFGDYLK